ncbi:GntR family transcriptional regulator [Vibrio sp.]|uniref:GntR family transcriptional regulator n=1 Tax=Vibrio viridaestus TaxID=2487322 RepID=A0A3N9TCY6_9VIBR|nr:GntR family transcriptional regulator [Vibrio viridaestus]MDC0610027.1 GntR family transcriptional regulator [Vibrio sp.]RQW61375.1 GntR family transcriptional regulator [Vibrio viridaestus]
MAESKRGTRKADSVDKVYSELKTLSIDYYFKPGKRINEVELAQRFGVSRTPIREALNRLAKEGFMYFVPNKGFYARDMTPKGVHELYELRAIIEQASFQLACQRASDEDIEKAAQIWEESCRTLPEPEQITDWTPVALIDEKFHMAIAKMANNSRLYETLESLNALSRFYRRIDLETPNRRNNAYDEHVEIIKALRNRDIEHGVKLLEKHVSLSSQHAVSVTKEGLARIFIGDISLDDI